MLAWILAQAPSGGLEWTEVLSSASPIGMLAIFIGALAAGKLILPREVESRDKRILQLEVERDEWKQMALSALTVGERVVSVAESKDRA
jgi:hypothetical protein